MQGTFQSSNNLIIGLSQPETAGIAVLVLQASSFALGAKWVTFFHMNNSYCKGMASLTSCEPRAFGGNGRIVSVPLTSVADSTKVLVSVAERVRWVTVRCSDVFHVGTWERRQTARKETQ